MKILIRTNMWPEDQYSPADILANDRVGDNIGNMLFVYSLVRWVQTWGDVEIDGIRDSQINRLKDINKKYDLILLPFANAFREDFMPFIRQWTKLIEGLTIPCVVVGIGVQAPLRIQDQIHFDFDDEVLRFCQAVLKHSASIGVRGEITKKYLIDCGVEADRVRVIGCPSIFIHGNHPVPVKKPPFSQLKPFAFNCTPHNPKYSLIDRWMAQYPDASFVPQQTWECVLLYIGYEGVHLDNGYCMQKDHEYFRQGRSFFFIDTLSWISYFHEQVGLSIGTRIHGNIAAIIAGVPALIIASDTRVKEICDFFRIPYLLYGEVDSQTRIEDWYARVDYEAYHRRYGEALEIYKAFLEENQVPFAVPDERVPFLSEKEIKIIRPCTLLGEEERIRRINQYFSSYQQRVGKKDAKKNKRISNLQNKFREKEKRVTELEMKISVIIAAYNAEKYLEEAMESVLNQTLEEYEVIVVNDGSTDATLSILADFSREYSHLKIITKKNGGPSSARNLGLAAAQGKYVYFMDSDDLLAGDALENLYNRAEDTQADLVIANYDIFTRDTVTKIKNLNPILKSSDISPYNLTILWSFSLWNKLFRKGVIDENALEFPPISYSEDGVFTMSFAYRAKKIVGLNKVIYHYRRMYDESDTAITATVNASKIRQYITAHKMIYEMAGESLAQIEDLQETEIDPVNYFSEINKKEVQILFNQFYRYFWTLDKESVDLIVREIKTKSRKVSQSAYSFLLSENYEAALTEMTDKPEEVLRHAHYTVAIYAGKEETEDFLVTLRSILAQNLVALRIVIPSFLEKTAEDADALQGNVSTAEGSCQSDFYNRVLDEAETEYILFTQAGYSYPNNALKRMFKYMSKGFADMAVQTIYQRDFGGKLPIYLNNVAFNSTRNGTWNNQNLCLDYVLSNKFFRTQYLKKQKLRFPERSEDILKKCYDTAYWVFLNDRVVFFEKDEKEFLQRISTEDTCKYIQEYYMEKPVDLRDPLIDHDSKLNYTKMMKYPRRKKWNRILQKWIAHWNRVEIKNRVCFISVRADGRLEGNAAALYPYIKGDKVYCARRLPHGLFTELKMLYYFMTSKVIVTDDYVRYARWIKLKPGQRMIQLWHACGAFKMFGQRGTNMSIREDRATHAQYSLVTVSGPSVRHIYADAFDLSLSRVAALGIPRTDLFFDEEYIRNTREQVYRKLPYLKDKEVILYAPTFRDVGRNRKEFQPDLDFDRLSADLKPNQQFIICPHPIMENDIIPHPYDNIHVVRQVSTNEMMLVSDKMITDYSSVIFEYALLHKPIAFYCYDLDTYNRGFFLKYPEDLPGNMYKTQKRLTEFILSSHDAVASERYSQFIKKYLAGCDGHSSARIAKIINSYMEVE